MPLGVTNTEEECEDDGFGSSARQSLLNCSNALSMVVFAADQYSTGNRLYASLGIPVIRDRKRWFSLGYWTPNLPASVITSEVRKPDRLRASSYTSEPFVHAIGSFMMGCFHVITACEVRRCLLVLPLASFDFAPAVCRRRREVDLFLTC